MNRRTPGLPVHHQLPESTQTHVRCVSDALQPSHPLLSPSPPAFNLSQHQGLFQWVSSSHQVAKILEFQLQHQDLLNKYSGLISFRIDWLDLFAVQGTLKSLIQYHMSLKLTFNWLKAISWPPADFMGGQGSAILPGRRLEILGKQHFWLTWETEEGKCFLEMRHSYQVFFFFFWPGLNCNTSDL